MKMDRPNVKPAQHRRAALEFQLATAVSFIGVGAVDSMADNTCKRHANLTCEAHQVCALGIQVQTVKCLGL